MFGLNLGAKDAASSLAHELGEVAALGPDCLLCALEARHSERYLLGIIGDGVNDPLLRRELTRRGGYCPPHLGKFVELAHVLASAILLHDLLTTRLARAARGNPLGRVHCPACEVEAKTRASVLKSLKRQRNDGKIQTILLGAPFCITHLELVSGAVPAVQNELANRHEDLVRALSELIRKHDYRFTRETITAAERASITKTARLFGVDGYKDG
ncbi:MAG: hypothetical protein M3511_00920 [Deinococcota bacterium]|nr:hypothetical protein [Deinococcota bacterium]